MLPDSDSANRNPRTSDYSGSNWLTELGIGTGMGDVAVVRSVGDRLMPLRIAMIALIALVMLGPLMTNVEGGGAGEGSIVRQIAYLAILAATIYAIRPTASPQSLLAISWPVLLAFAWCWISLSWAIDPGTAFRRVLLTTLVAWMVFSLVRHGGYQLNVDVLRYAARDDPDLVSDRRAGSHGRHSP